MSVLSSSLSLTLGTWRLELHAVPFDERLDHLSCRLDGRIIWQANTASWRPLSVVANLKGVLFWSARHLVAVAPDGPVQDVESGEDLIAVFPRDETVVVIGESSVRIHRRADLALLDRVELRDIATEWDLRGSRLCLRLLDGTAVEFGIRDDRIAQTG